MSAVQIDLIRKRNEPSTNQENSKPGYVAIMRTRPHLTRKDHQMTTFTGWMIDQMVKNGKYTIARNRHGIDQNLHAAGLIVIDVDHTVQPGELGMAGTIHLAPANTTEARRLIKLHTWEDLMTGTEVAELLAAGKTGDEIVAIAAERIPRRITYVPVASPTTNA
jgi:hypothetical protein